MSDPLLPGGAPLPPALRQPPVPVPAHTLLGIHPQELTGLPPAPGGLLPLPVIDHRLELSSDTLRALEAQVMTPIDQQLGEAHGLVTGLDGRILAPLDQGLGRAQKTLQRLDQRVLDGLDHSMALTVTQGADLGLTVPTAEDLALDQTGAVGSKAFIGTGAPFAAVPSPVPQPGAGFWWCHQCPATTGGYSIQATQSPDPICDGDLVSGPYASMAEAQQCLNGVSPGPPPPGGPIKWWCHTLRDGSKLCTTDALQRGPQDFIHGPWATPAECWANCGAGGPQPGPPPGPFEPAWYCHNPGSPGAMCDQDPGSHNPGDVPAGPYPSLDQCQAQCTPAGGIPPPPGQGCLRTFPVCPVPVINIPPCPTPAPPPVCPPARIVVVPCPTPQPPPVPPVCPPCPSPAPPPGQTPPPEGPPPDASGKGALPSWASPDICRLANALGGRGVEAHSAVTAVIDRLKEIPLVGGALADVASWIVSIYSGATLVSDCNLPMTGGLITARSFIAALEHWGGLDLDIIHRTLTYWINSECQTVAIEAPMAIDAWMAGAIDRPTYECYVRAHGFSPAQIEPYVDSRRDRPSVDQILALHLRGVLDDAARDKALRERGVYRREDVDRYVEFERALPTAADLARFAVRHCFEPDLLEKFTYDAEFQPAMKAWLEKVGLGYTVPGLRSSTTGPDKSWADAFWWAHWIGIPSPGQGYQMLYRLAPDRDKAGEPDWQQKLDFSLDDLRLLLRANDTPPYWRDRLAAISQRLLGVRQLRALLSTGVWQEKDAVTALRRQGYTQPDAEKYAAALVQELKAKEDGKKLKEILAELKEAWQIGTLSDDDLVQAMLTIGIERDTIDRELTTLRTRLMADQARAAIRSVRRGYLRGVYTEDQAREALNTAGIQSQRVVDYVRQWSLERTVAVREASAGQILRGAEEGIIAIPDVITRLRNLNYSDDAILVMVSELLYSAEQKALSAVQKLEQKAQRAEKQSEAALERAIKQREQQARTARSDLARHGSPSKLSKWLCDGLIGLPEARLRLEELGWPDADIERLFSESCPAKSTIPPKQPTPLTASSQPGA